jgi:hypothetical protein
MKKSQQYPSSLPAAESLNSGLDSGPNCFTAVCFITSSRTTNPGPGAAQTLLPRSQLYGNRILAAAWILLGCTEAKQDGVIHFLSWQGITGVQTITDKAALIFKVNT